MKTYKFTFYQNGKNIEVKMRFESFFEKDFEYAMKELDNYLQTILTKQKGGKLYVKYR